MINFNNSHYLHKKDNLIIQKYQDPRGLIINQTKLFVNKKVQEVVLNKDKDRD